MNDINLNKLKTVIRVIGISVSKNTVYQPISNKKAKVCIFVNSSH